MPSIPDMTCQLQDASQSSGSVSAAEGSRDASVVSLEVNLQAVRLAKALRVGAIIQDLSDSTLALNDIRGGCGSSIMLHGCIADQHEPRNGDMVAVIHGLLCSCRWS